MYKTPTYLAKLIKLYSSLRVQRPHNLHQIEINTTKKSTHNRISFSIAEPIEWNKPDIDLIFRELTS